VYSNKALFVARADGSGARQITDGTRDFSPRSSPDGRRVAFVRSVAPGETAIWIVNANGSGAHPLDDVHRYAEHPRWWPAGRWIAYQVQTSTHVRTGLRAHTPFELWLVRPDGSERHRLKRGAGEIVDDNPLYSVAGGAWAWSPDGRRIAAIAGGEACGSIWTVPRERGKRHRVTRPSKDPTGANSACDLWPRWTAGGRSIVIVRSAGEGGSRRLFRVRTDGTHLQRIRPLALARYHWPTRCPRLFEYASDYGRGWIVRASARSAPRFVRFPAGGRTICDPDSADPCEQGGDWHCS
jgi:Tol biopolymer transport system component